LICKPYALTLVPQTLKLQTLMIVLCKRSQDLLCQKLDSRNQSQILNCWNFKIMRGLRRKHLPVQFRQLATQQITSAVQGQTPSSKTGHGGITQNCIQSYCCHKFSVFYVKIILFP
jgi:hypothetical protein